MLSFEEILAIESEFVKEHKLPVCIVPMRYLKAVYNVPAADLDELCFLVSVEKESCSLSDYCGVKVFYVREKHLISA